MVLGSVPISFFARSFPFLPAPVIEETLFSPLYTQNGLKT